jgi:hypothetical protein
MQTALAVAGCSMLSDKVLLQPMQAIAAAQHDLFAA